MKQQYVLIAYDDTDTEALSRRMAVRPSHLEMVEQLKSQESYIQGGAILDDDGKMIGSAMMVAFNNKEELHAWLKVEPYVVGKVWKTIEVRPFRCAVIKE